MATKKKTTSRPSVPTAQQVPALKEPSAPPSQEYKPMTLADFTAWMNTAYDLQLRRAPEIAHSKAYEQALLFNNMAALQLGQAPNYANAAAQILQGYNPEFRQSYQQQRQNIFGGTELGNAAWNNALADIQAGRELGPGLSREIEQSIRGAQTARGNILGAAPTAQEAFGTGMAAENLYRQRLGTAQQLHDVYIGQAQNFLQGRNPMDMMGQVAGTFLGQQYYPSQAYVDTGLGAQAMANIGSQQSAYNATAMQGYSSFQGALQDYNKNLISGTSVTNEGIFNTYDRRAESWMYDEAVRRGLYSTPSMGGGGGGGMMGGMGGIGSALGGVGTGMMGLAASGVIGTGATAGAVGIAGAVAGAGAAICWLARRCIPDRWEQFQHYLFTEAPEKLRRLYLYNARRLAREITEDEAIEIGDLMNDCLDLR